MAPRDELPTLLDADTDGYGSRLCIIFVCDLRVQCCPELCVLAIVWELRQQRLERRNLLGHRLAVHTIGWIGLRHNWCGLRPDCALQMCSDFGQLCAHCFEMAEEFEDAVWN